MKKTFLFLASLITCAGFAHEGYVKTGIKIEPEFAPVVKDEEKNIDEINFLYSKTLYEANLLDFNMKFKEYGLDFGGSIKSKRSNARLNDWDNDKKHSKDDKNHDKNHDLMSKFYLSYTSPEFFGLKSKSKIEYYPDKDMFKKDNKTVSEYVEDEQKQIAGNILFDTNLSGKINKKVNFDANIKYKANQLDTFDKDESYFKYDVKADGDVNDKFNLSGKYDFTCDLNFGSKPFDTFKTELPEYPDFWDKNYVKRIEHNLNFETTYKVDKKTNLKFSFDNNMLHYFQKGSNEKTKVRNIYSLITPNVKFAYEKELNNGLKLGPELEVESQIREAKFYTKDSKPMPNKGMWANLKQGLNLKLDYDKDGIKYEGRYGYRFDLTTQPFLTNLKNAKHNLKSETKLSVKKEFNKNTKLEGKIENKFEIPIVHRYLGVTNTKFNADIKVNHKINDKLNLEFAAKNKLDLTSEKTVIGADNYTENLKLNATLNYDPIKNLSLKTTLGFENKMKFNVNLNQDRKEVGKANITIHRKHTPFIFNGKSDFQYIINRFTANTTLSYEKKLNDKLTIKPSVDLNTKLELFALRNNVLTTYGLNKKASNLVKPEISDYRNIKYNVGGSIELNPSIELKYKFIEKLMLSTSFGTKLKFERKVINPIQEDGRPDKNSFDYIEKSFGFRSLSPTVKLNLEYRW